MTTNQVVGSSNLPQRAKFRSEPIILDAVRVGFMPLKVWFKIVFLSMSLAMVILVIVWLRQGHLPAFWTSLGLDSNRFNWCEERVKSLYIFDLKARLYEAQGVWYWEQERENRTLDYLRVEKWFAGYCQVDSKTVEVVSPDQKSRVVFEAEFLNGDHLILHKKGDYFEIRGQFFQSEALRRGLKELLAFGSKME